jgi:type IV pilus assembly protein PilW
MSHLTPTHCAPMPQHSRQHSHTQTGFSLVELMVAMAVGLIISAGAAALFANTILSTRTLNSATQINELGTQISSTLGRQLRMAGYIDWISNGLVYGLFENSDKYSDAYNGKAATNTFFQAGVAAQHALAVADMPFAVHGCNGEYDTDTLSNKACTTGTVSPITNGLTLAYQVRSDPKINFSASLSNAAFSNATGMAGDCNNQSPTLWPTPAGSPGLFVVNRYYLKPSAVTTAAFGEPILYDLMCLGNGNIVPQPIASNLEQFVVTYGIPASNVSPDSNDLRVASYQTAAQIDTANAWGQVIAVRTCVLIAGERNSATNVGASDKPDCNGNVINFGNERRLRQAFTTTVAMRNQIHTATLNEN